VTIYEQLAAEGYIETAAGARARVSLGLKPLPPKPQPLAARRPHRVASISAYGKRIEVLALPQPPVTDPAHINFLYGAIADEDFPKLAWRRHYNRALMRRQQHLYYGATAGELQLREELQAYLLRARGLACTADQILIVHGTQQAPTLRQGSRGSWRSCGDGGALLPDGTPHLRIAGRQHHCNSGR